MDDYTERLLKFNASSEIHDLLDYEKSLLERFHNTGDVWFAFRALQALASFVELIYDVSMIERKKSGSERSEERT